MYCTYRFKATVLNFLCYFLVILWDTNWISSVVSGHRSSCLERWWHAKMRCTTKSIPNLNTESLYFLWWTPIVSRSHFENDKSFSTTLFSSRFFNRPAFHWCAPTWPDIADWYQIELKFSMENRITEIVVEFPFK